MQLKNIKESTIIKNITKDSAPYVIFSILKDTKYNFVSYIVDNNFDLELVKKEINFYSKDIEILDFPEWNTIPYDINSPQLKIQTTRNETIYKLLHYDKLFKNKKVLFLISQKAILQKIINHNDFKYINFKIKQKITLDNIKEILKENCYSMTETASEIGDYSINNNNIDVITFEEKAYRIILKNNQIEQIKSYNPKTQISLHNFEEILILPIKEVIFNKKNIKNFKINYMSLFDFQNQQDKLYQSIINNVFYSGCENWLPLFYENKLETIFDYLPQNSIICFLNNTISTLKHHQQTIEKYYNLRLEESKIKQTNSVIYNPIKPDLFYINCEIFNEKISQFLTINFDTENILSNKNTIDLNIKNVPNFFHNSKEVFKDLNAFLNKN